MNARTRKTKPLACITNMSTNILQATNRINATKKGVLSNTMMSAAVVTKSASILMASTMGVITREKYALPTMGAGRIEACVTITHGRRVDISNSLRSREQMSSRWTGMETVAMGTHVASIVLATTTGSTVRTAMDITVLPARRTMAKG